MIVATEAGLYPVTSVQAEIEHLAELATIVLNEHVNDNGVCAKCPGVAFPCVAAVLAGHNTALL